MTWWTSVWFTCGSPFFTFYFNGQGGLRLYYLYATHMIMTQNVANLISFPLLESNYANWQRRFDRRRFWADSWSQNIPELTRKSKVAVDVTCKHQSWRQVEVNFALIEFAPNCAVDENSARAVFGLPFLRICTWFWCSSGHGTFYERWKVKYSPSLGSLLLNCT